eukprot:maker-scaffold_31-snap-gene-1.4-mRNA-1 protein AED:0.20 eAED:0.20 QI:91/1/1/1/1/1/2/38/575
MSSFLSHIAKEAESWLEAVDQQAAETVESFQKLSEKEIGLAEVGELAERLKKREKYVSKNVKSLPQQTEVQPKETTNELKNDSFLEDVEKLNAQISQDPKDESKETQNEERRDSFFEQEMTAELKTSEERELLLFEDNDDPLIEKTQVNAVSDAVKLSIPEKETVQDEVNLFKALLQEKDGALGKLHNENSLLDAKLVELQQELDVAEEVLLNSKSKGEEERLELKQKITEIEEYHLSREEEFISEITLKTKELDQLKLLLHEFEDETRELKEKAAILEDSNEKLEASKTDISEKLLQFESLKKSKKTDLSKEVNRLENKIREINSIHKQELSRLETKSSELRRENESLSNELVKRNNLSVSTSALDTSVDLSGLKDQIHNLKEEKKSLTRLVEQEQSKVVSLEIKNKNILKDRRKTESEQAQYIADLKTNFDVITSEKQNLEKEIELLSKGQKTKFDVDLLEKKVEALTETLSKRYKEIENLRTENSLLVRKLNIGSDVELGSFRRRKPSVSERKKMSRIQVLQKNQQVKEVVDQIDDFCFTFGNKLYRAPAVRLTFILYSIFVHLLLLKYVLS